MVFTRVSGHCLLWPVTMTFLTLTPKASQHIYEPSTPVAKIGWNSLHWFLRYGVHKMFGTRRLRHSQTDKPEYSIPPTLLFNDGGCMRNRHKAKLTGRSYGSGFRGLWLWGWIEEGRGIGRTDRRTNGFAVAYNHACKASLAERCRNPA